MLREKEIPYHYREYTENPLSKEELLNLFKLLQVSPSTLLRRRDKAYKALQLSGQESDEALIALMAEHPTLLQRPIGVYKNRAIVGRPPEKLLDLLNES